MIERGHRTTPAQSGRRAGDRSLETAAVFGGRDRCRRCPASILGLTGAHMRRCGPGRELLHL
jgi:hypothetical protein